MVVIGLQQLWSSCLQHLILLLSSYKAATKAGNW
jgi:hypothetical protein